MRSKKLIVMLCLVFLTACNSQGKAVETEYQLGRNYHCFLASIQDDVVFYKDEAIGESGEFENAGLYAQRVEKGSYGTDTLLCVNFFSCPNFYNDQIFYIDTSWNISCVDIETLSVSQILAFNYDVTNLLIINDFMYFTVEKEEQQYDLYEVDLHTNDSILLTENVNWVYLYNYRDNIAVVSLEQEKVMIYSRKENQWSYYSFEDELMHLFDDDICLCLKTDGTLYFCTLDGEFVKELARINNIRHVIADEENITITTVDGSGYISVYSYSREEDELQMVGSPDYLPQIHTEEYLICFSEAGSYEVQLLEKSTKKREAFAMH